MMRPKKAPALCVDTLRKGRGDDVASRTSFWLYGI